MEKLIIDGGLRLSGEMEVHSAKNCVLALLAASILTDKQVIIHKCPKIADVMNMIKILKYIGSEVFWQGDTLLLQGDNIKGYEIPSLYAKEIRSSQFLMGALLSRLKKSKASYPGGCDIGIRPIDLHLKGFRALNIKIVDEGGYLICDGENASGGRIHLDFPSVGATENIILASVMLKGKTTITNAAKEPEIVALQEFLNLMGAKVFGAGTDIIEIEGVNRLNGVEYTPIPDRIVAGTYLIAGAITHGELLIKNCQPKHFEALTDKLRYAVSKIKVYQDSVYIKADGENLSIPITETQPYPGFPTDMQAQILSLQTVSKGSSLIVENIFETRYKHVPELTKMGANIVVKDKVVLIRGVKHLHGAEVCAYDLRGGAALVLAGLCASGRTEIGGVKHIDRGYVKFDEILTSVGAKISRIDDGL